MGVTAEEEEGVIGLNAHLCGGTLLVLAWLLVT